MRLAHTQRFDEERARYRFAFTCESCAHFDAQKERCRHGYPNEAHRQAYYDAVPEEIVFCKEFELG